MIEMISKIIKHAEKPIHRKAMHIVIHKRKMKFYYHVNMIKVILLFKRSLNDIEKFEFTKEIKSKMCLT